MTNQENINTSLSLPLAGHKVPVAAQLIGASTTTAWKLIHEGKLGHYRILNRVYVSDKHIADYLAASEVKPGEKRNAPVINASALVAKAMSKSRKNSAKA